MYLYYLKKNIKALRWGGGGVRSNRVCLVFVFFFILCWSLSLNFLKNIMTGSKVKWPGWRSHHQQSIFLWKYPAGVIINYRQSYLVLFICTLSKVYFLSVWINQSLQCKPSFLFSLICRGDICKLKFRFG